MTEQQHALAIAAADQELERIGLCAWLEARQPEFARAERGSAARQRLDDAFLAHAEGCAQCTRRLEVMDRLQEVVSTPLERAWVRGIRWHVRQPEWLRPAITGGAVMGGLSLMRVLIGILRLDVLTALLGLGLSIAIGGGVGLVGGNAYRILKPWGEKRGWAGPYLAGLLFAATLGFATALVLLAIPETSPTFRRPLGWVLTGAFVLVGGIGAGGAWFRKGTRFKVV